MYDIHDRDLIMKLRELFDVRKEQLQKLRSELDTQPMTDRDIPESKSEQRDRAIIRIIDILLEYEK